MKNAHIVVDLGFGDSGKGITTDFLCSRYEKERTLVVRYSGGQQAGHAVMINGVKHVHSNFGSGTLRGVPSYFSEYCTFYLNGIVKEHRVFKSKGVKPVLFIHPLAMVTTPYDVAFNRVSEERVRNGSCGLGIGATMTRNTTPYKLYAVDLNNFGFFQQKLNSIHLYYEDKIKYFQEEEKVKFRFIAQQEMKEFATSLEVWQTYFEIRHPEFMYKYFDNFIFEGSQGIMLDMDHGIFPNVTYANTTSKNAIKICEDELGMVPDIWYVTRCYQTRHGKGWMSNEGQPVHLINNEEEINSPNTWQGTMRTAEIDYKLLDHALVIDRLYSPRCKRNLVMTCLDQRPGFKVPFDLAMSFKSFYGSFSPDCKDFVEGANITDTIVVKTLMS